LAPKKNPVVLCFFVSLISCQLLSGLHFYQVKEIMATQVSGPHTVMVILAEFSDTKHVTSQDRMHDLILSSLSNYYREVSFNQTWFEGTTTKWYQLPNPEAFYATGRGWNRDWSKARLFIKAAVDAADDDVDFSKYSLVIVVHAGSMEPLWHSFYAGLGGILRTPIETRDRVSINGAVVLAEKNTLGVIVHEVGHYLGLPDLYDDTLANDGKYSQVYMGDWCLMSVANGQGMCAYSKLRLGWIRSSSISVISPRQTGMAEIAPLELPTSGILAVRIPLSSRTHYLVEVRQQIGVDKALPSKGVLISLVDESIQQFYWEAGRGPVRIQDANPEVPRFRDAAFDVGAGRNPVFVDLSNNLAIVVLWKANLSYAVQVTTPNKVSTILDASAPINEAELKIEQAQRTQLKSEEAKTFLGKAVEQRDLAIEAFKRNDLESALTYARNAMSFVDQMWASENRYRTATATSTVSGTRMTLDQPPASPPEFSPIAIAIAVAALVILAFLISKRKR